MSLTTEDLLAQEELENGELREQLAACQKERDEYRAALEICKKEMQGDKWDALYIDTVLAKYAHTDHPLRHYDRTCPACNTEEKP